MSDCSDLEFIVELECDVSPRTGLTGWESVLFMVADENENPAAGPRDFDGAAGG
jgi:hypothetical protein